MTQGNLISLEEQLDKVYGNEDINDLIEKVKQKLNEYGFLYKTGKNERKRATNILKHKPFGEFAELVGKDRVETTLAVIDQSMKDEFRKGKIYNLETIYKHYTAIYNNYQAKRTNKSNLIVL